MDKNVKFWNRVSKFYTLIQEKGNKMMYLEISNKCIEYIRNNNILELACGTGQLTINLSKYSSSYLATDYSSNMIKNAKKRKIDNVNYSVMDATNMNLKDNSFDVVIIANALHIMPNPSACLEQIKRVLKKDGILIAPTFIYDTKPKGLKIWFSSKFGFKTFHKWKSHELINFISSYDYEVLKDEKINAKPLDIEFVVVKNIK